MTLKNGLQATKTNNMKSTLHQVVKTEQAAYENLIEAWQEPLNKLQSLIESFAGYKNYLGAFTQEYYNDLSKIHQKFLTEIEKDYIKKFGELSAKVFLKNADEIYQPLADAIENFKKSLTFTPGKPVLSFSDVQIIEGKPVLQKDEILKRYQYTLETPSQVEIYDLVQAAIKAYNEANGRLLAFAKPNDVPMLHERYGLLFEDRNGFLDFNFTNLNRIR